MGNHRFILTIDGEFAAEGPYRFHKDHPEYQQLRREFPPGRHVIGALVHDEMECVRFSSDTPVAPFWTMDAIDQGGNAVPIQWKCEEMSAYLESGVRLNPQLAWTEHCDLRLMPAYWRTAQFDDTTWAAPAPINQDINPDRPVDVGPVYIVPVENPATATGALSGGFSWSAADHSWGFYKRNLAPAIDHINGSWRRYDLGKVRLTRPVFLINAPAGTKFEIAFAEELTHGRVLPHIQLSNGPSCPLYRYILREGRNEIEVFQPVGGRYVEVHLGVHPDRGGILDENFLERTYFPDRPTGQFTCSDRLLGRIWKVGVETLRSCAEDALVDTPTRERGQWNGDCGTVGLEIIASAYHDARLVRRSLQQSAWSAQPGGLVAGLSPRDVLYIPMYAALWTGSCLRYVETTGDYSILRELYPYARRNRESLNHFTERPTHLHSDLHSSEGFNFIDWGYEPASDQVDPALRMRIYASAVQLAEWATRMDDPLAESDKAYAEKLRTECLEWLSARATTRGIHWEQIGFHCAIFALELNLLTPELESPCMAYVKNYIRSCFPNDPHAARLSAPDVRGSSFLTPFFAHFAFPPLIARGEMDFVLSQYRKCWGWALGSDRTTWLEVFDTSWSHCHHWSGCPTWQLSQFVLGLRQRFDRAKGSFDFNFSPGNLSHASGRIPLSTSGYVDVAWHRTNDGYHFHASSADLINLRFSGDLERLNANQQWRNSWSFDFDIRESEVVKL